MTPKAIKDLAVEFRREMLLKFAAIEAAHGKAVAGVFVEATLDASALYLNGSVGPKVTYNALQRRADAAAGIVVERAARHQ
jgi:hypothetical protein